MKTVALGLFTLVLQASLALAAPMPLTSTSVFISGAKGLFQSPLGFRLDAADTNWKLTPKPKNNHYIKTMYRSVDHPEALLTVRADKISGPVNVAQYAKKWLNDYPRFGFEVLKAKRVNVDHRLGYLIDLVSHESSKQLRQVLFVKGDYAVTLTCRDNIHHFATALKSCDRIISSFRW